MNIWQQLDLLMIGMCTMIFIPALVMTIIDAIRNSRRNRSIKGSR